jgi:hypothetical protein
MSKKLKPSEDPAYFEYEPHEDEVSDEELCEIMLDINQDPEDIKDLAFKKVYLKYLEDHKDE